MLKLDDFTPLVGEAFALVDGQDGRHRAALVEARALSTPAHGGRQAFALLFDGPGEPALPLCTYSVQHPALAPVDIFLVPVGRAAAGVQYEAIFN
jgi:hypothetical protein